MITGRTLWHPAILVLCATALAAGAADRKPQPARSSAILDKAQAQVGRFASKNPGSVNTYWLQVPRGLVIVDTGRNVSGGRRAVAEIKRTGQPVAAIVITHPHPDHVGGMGVLHDSFPQAPVYASEATVRWMRSDPLRFFPLARQADPDYPATLTYPDHIIAPNGALQIGGAKLETAQFGPGESQTATTYYEAKTGALFSGDLTDNHATPALIEGHICAWLTHLDQLQARFPHARTIYPGHGAPGVPKQQITEQRNYLRHTRSLVRPATAPASPAGKNVSPAEQKSILADIDRAYPNHPLVASLTTLPQVNVQAVAGELRAEDPAKLPPACR